MRILVVTFITLALTHMGCKKSESQPSTEETVKVSISGKEYSTVKIGNQRWTSVNYEGPGGVSYTIPQPKPEYGKYYTFQEALAVPLPAGWRLPSKDDFVELALSQGILVENYRAFNNPNIKKLVSKSNWKNIPGSNLSGFNAQPAGYIFQNSTPMDGDISEFWTSEGVTFSLMESGNLQNHNLQFYDNTGQQGYRFNLRFVKTE